MADWRIELTSSAEKSLKRLSHADQTRVKKAIDDLPTGDIRKLTGRSDQFRLRVGELRITFVANFKSRSFVILDMFHRGAGYR